MYGFFSIAHIASFKNGIACQKYFPKEDEVGAFKVIKIREFSSGLDKNSDVVTSNVPEDLIIQDGDVLFSWSATLDVKLWTGGIGALNQHIFKVDSIEYPKSFYYFKVLEPPRVSRRPNFLREYPNEKYLLT